MIHIFLFKIIFLNTFLPVYMKMTKMKESFMFLICNLLLIFGESLDNIYQEDVAAASPAEEELKRLILRRLKRYKQKKDTTETYNNKQIDLMQKEGKNEQNLALTAPWEENWQPGDHKEVELMAKRAGYKDIGGDDPNSDDDDNDEDDEGINIIKMNRAGVEPRDCKNTKNKIWDQWGEWSACTVTCGIGLNTRWRHCVSGTCASGEKEAQIRTCTFPAC